ncbi:hypothetical protein M2140_000188 [Clostridiales Family XIII bacterium PM5-7]
MQTNHEKLLKDYYRQIKMMLPVKTAYERRFLRHLKSQIQELIHATPNWEYYDVVRQFGMPKDVVAGYYASIPTKQLDKELRGSRIIKVALITCLLIVLGVFLFKFYLLEKGSMESNEKYENRKIIEYGISSEETP